MRLQLKWKFPRKCSTECFKRCSVRYFPRQARAKLLVEKANGIKGASLLDKTISMNHSRNPGTPIFYYLHMLLVKRVRTLAATLKCVSSCCVEFVPTNFQTSVPSRVRTNLFLKLYDAMSQKQLYRTLVTDKNLLYFYT